MNEPLVSVIIPAYNSERYLTQCLNSVIAQTYQNWEAIIVCSPSTDRTINIACNYTDPRVEIIIEGTKTNCATARNTGLESCHGEYITFLDSDDWWCEDRLQELVWVMESDPTIQWAVHHMIMHQGDITWPSTEHPREKHRIEGINAMLFRRELLYKIRRKWGYVFNEKMNSVDDADLVIRMRDEPSIVIEKYLYHYRYNPDGLTSGTSQSKMFYIIMGIATRNKCYDIIPVYVKDIVIITFNNLFGCDIVKWKRSVLK